jgi:hypothetical protein
MDIGKGSVGNLLLNILLFHHEVLPVHEVAFVVGMPV